MKNLLLLSCLLFGLTITLPNRGHSAISRQLATEIEQQNQAVKTGKKAGRWLLLKEKFGKKFNKLKRKIEKWKQAIQLNLPSGKLLTSLVFLLLSIILFAVGGLTKLGVLFNLLGSLAVILALVFFILWLSERSNAANPIN